VESSGRRGVDLLTSGGATIEWHEGCVRGPPEESSVHQANAVRTERYVAKGNGACVSEPTGKELEDLLLLVRIRRAEREAAQVLERLNKLEKDLHYLKEHTELLMKNLQ
jgi:hypothetical protein